MLHLYTAISAICTVITALINLSAGLKLLWIVPVTFAGTFIGFILLQCLIFVITVLLIDVKKPPERFSKPFRFMVKLLLDVLVPIVRVKIHTTGLNKVPKSKRFLLVSNHLFDFDPAVFMYCMPEAELAFIGKKEIYKDLKFVAKAMHKLHGLPIDRENNRSAVLTINKAAETIKNDLASIAIFPEGYTSKTGELLPFRNGAFKIAKKAHCPIVVATIKNTRQIVKNMFFKKTDVYLDILAVVDETQVDALSTAELSDNIHALMAENLNQSI